MKLLQKLYDPYKTVKRLSYKEARAEYKKQEQRFVRFWTIAFWVVTVAMLLIFFAERLARLAT